MEPTLRKTPRHMADLIHAQSSRTPASTYAGHRGSMNIQLTKLKIIITCSDTDTSGTTAAPNCDATNTLLVKAITVSAICATRSLELSCQITRKWAKLTLRKSGAMARWRNPKTYTLKRRYAQRIGSEDARAKCSMLLERR